MPLNENCVRKLATYFDYYKHLTFCEWEEGIEDILSALTAYQQSCLALVKIHEYIMAVLKRREDDAKVRGVFKNRKVIYCVDRPNYTQGKTSWVLVWEIFTKTSIFVFFAGIGSCCSKASGN